MTEPGSAQTRRSPSRSSGYSLVELITVIAITGVVALVPAQVLLESMRVYARTAPRLDAAYQAQLAVERLGRDFRDLSSRSSLSVMTSSSLTFDNSNGTVVYALSGSDLTRNGDLIASAVSALTLTYWDTSGSVTSSASAVNLLDIDLTVTVANQPYRMLSTVFPRNPVESPGLLDQTASAASAYQHKADHFHVDLVSIASNDLEIATIDLSADSSAPNLKELKLDNKKIIQNVDVALPTSVTALNDGSSGDRTIEAGDNPNARIKFKDDFDDGTYEFTLVLTFTDGSTDSIIFSVTF